MSYGGLGWQDHAVFAHEKDQEIARLKRENHQLGDDLTNMVVSEGRVSDMLAKAESTLATQAEELLAYKDYYGTSVNQVKHLQECGACDASRCCEASFFCPDYPSE